MARIKLKLGENEIEVDSRDFYVDNQTLGEIIDNISQYMPENQAKIVYESDSKQISTNINNGLESLDDAETFEPEFNDLIDEKISKNKSVSFNAAVFEWSSGLRQAKLKGKSLSLID